MTDNVTPIAPMSQCAGCGATVRHEDRFDPEKHGPACPQPEIRMRRAEALLDHLKQVVYQLVESNNDTVRNQIDLDKRMKALESGA